MNTDLYESEDYNGPCNFLILLAEHFYYFQKFLKFKNYLTINLRHFIHIISLNVKLRA